MTAIGDIGAPAVGPAIRAARRDAGVTLRELARRIAVSPGTVSAIENGKTRVDLDRLHAVAAALGLGAAEVLDYGRPGAPTRRRTGAPERAAGELVDWRVFAPLAADPVLHAAITEFVEKGYHGSTMRLIAQRAGMSVPGVYHHYQSKQDLLVAAMELAMSELHERVPAARAEGGDPVRRLALMVEALALFHTQRRELALIGASEMRSLEPPHRQRIAALRTGIQRLLDEEIDAGVAAGRFTTTSPRDAGRAISTMCTSLPQWFRPGGPASAERVAAEYAGFAVRLLGHP